MQRAGEKKGNSKEWLEPLSWASDSPLARMHAPEPASRCLGLLTQASQGPLTYYTARIFIYSGNPVNM
jgi:hypothetical protein